MIHLFPALLVLDYERNEIVRYERFAHNGVRRTHRAEPQRIGLRNMELNAFEANEMRIMMPMEFLIGNESGNAA